MGRCSFNSGFRMDATMAIVRINHQLDRIGVPHEVNESRIEAFLDDLETVDPTENPAYWLILARLTEATLLCAGHYADHCEFSAAGDLLVNPRKIMVHVKGRAGAFAKERHGRLSDQLARMAPMGSDRAPVSMRDAVCETVTLALLPALHERLTQAGCFGRTYLDHVHARMMAVADTTCFLAAWGVTSGEALHQWLQSGSESQRVFIQEHLCRFDPGLFHWFGRWIDRLKGRRCPIGASVDTQQFFFEHATGAVL